MQAGEDVGAELVAAAGLVLAEGVDDEVFEAQSTYCLICATAAARSLVMIYRLAICSSVSSSASRSRSTGSCTPCFWSAVSESGAQNRQLCRAMSASR